MTAIYLDSGSYSDIVRGIGNNKIRGFTTNPSLIAKSGVVDYKEFVEKVLKTLALRRDRDTSDSLSVEVFADDYAGMISQAKTLNALGVKHNYPVFVKIPIMYTSGKLTTDVITKLSENQISVNVTAVFTQQQFNAAIDCVNPNCASIISIFAGRIADTGVDPATIIHDCVSRNRTMNSILWASAREPFNYYQARDVGADIITMPLDMINKLEKFEKINLTGFSLDTCQEFYDVAVRLGYKL